MPKPLSEDLRRRVIDYYNEGLMQRKISEILKVSTSFVSRLLFRYKEEKTIKPKIPQITKPRKVNYEKVKEYIEANSDKTLKEVGDKFNIHLTASFYIFKKLGITYKKRDSYRKNEMKKKEENL